MDKVLRFRLLGGDRELLQRAAGKAGLNLSLWCRLRLLQCARTELGLSSPQDETERAVKRLAPEQEPPAFKPRPDPERPTVHRQAIPKPEWKK